MVEESKITFSKYVNDAGISDSLQAECLDSDILMLPPELKGSTYPEMTNDIYKFLQQELPEGLKINLPVEDDDYEETRFYEVITMVAVFLVTSIAIPIVVNILSHFFIKKMEKKKKKSLINFTFIVDDKDGNKSKKTTYEGNNEGFRDFLTHFPKISKKE